MKQRRTPPHLPFLDGPAVMAPKLRPIQEENWFAPDTEAESWLSSKRELMVQRRSEVYAEAGGWATEAACEAAELVLSSGVTEPFKHASFCELERAASTVSDDLCVMVPREGQFCLGAASLCAPTFWSLAENIGKPVAGLHALLPAGGAALAERINRIFAGLQPGMLLERFNWTVQYGDARFTPTSAPMKQAMAELPTAETAPHLYLRVERQTVRKLPESGAVLFTIRICVDALAPLLEDAIIREPFLEAWRSTAHDVADYKGWPHHEPAVQFLGDAC